MKKISDCYELAKVRKSFSDNSTRFLNEGSFYVDVNFINLNTKKGELILVRESNIIWVDSRRGYQSIKRKKHEKNI